MGLRAEIREELEEYVVKSTLAWDGDPVTRGSGLASDLADDLTTVVMRALQRYIEAEAP